MSKKNVLGILLSLVLFLMVSPFYVYAEDDTVKDMFKNSNKQGEQQGTVEPEESESSVTPDGVDENLSVNEELDNGSLVFNIIQMVFALFLILVLIYLLLKFLNKRNKVFSQVKALENLGGIAVGPSKSIQIVRVGNKLYLIGVGENVQLLEEIEDEDMKEEIIKSYGEQPEFKPENILSLFQRKSKQEDSDANNSSENFKNLFSNELEKLKQNRKNLLNKHTEKEDNHE